MLQQNNLSLIDMKNTAIILGSEHRGELERILYSDPAHHIHQIYELEQHGLSEERKTFRGIKKDHTIEGVLFSDGFRKGGTGFITGRSDEICNTLITCGLSNGLRTIIGPENCIEPALNTKLSKGKTVRRWHVYRCLPKNLIPSYDYPVRQATPKDVDQLANLYSTYEYRAHDDIESIRKEILDNLKANNTYFVVEQENTIAASAMIYLETSFAAMIGAARVLPAYRGKGIYCSLRTACIESLFSKSKYAMGFFVEGNRAMEKIIQKNGGEDIGNWLVLQPSPEPGPSRISIRRIAAYLRRKLRPSVDGPTR
jgi:N-acetylglutamate synthase-like GNAT family acetyltransferase